MYYTGTRTVLFLFSLITFANGDEDTCAGIIPHLLTSKASVDGDPIWRARTGDVLECARSCVRMTKCRSFGFDSTSGMCQAYSRVGTGLRPASHIVHSDISKWPSQIDPDCFPRPCGEDDVCIPGSVTGRLVTDTPSCSHACLTISRQCPYPEGSTSSQPRTVGSVYTHTCGRGTVGGGDSALCLPTGQWNNTVNTTCTPVYGGGCDSDADCTPIHGYCIEHVCTCRTGSRYDHVERMCVEAVYGGGCDSDADCTPIHGYCIEHVCTCRTGSRYDHVERMCMEECPENGIFGGKCYFIENTAVDFFEAQEVCNRSGGHLVEIETEAKSLVVKDFLQILRNKLVIGTRDLWIGMLEDANGVERWLTSNDTLTFTDWRNGEPNNQLGDFIRERCAIIVARAPFQWVDILCIHINIPLCEKVL